MWSKILCMFLLLSIFIIICTQPTRSCKHSLWYFRIIVFKVWNANSIAFRKGWYGGKYHTSMPIISNNLLFFMNYGSIKMCVFKNIHFTKKKYSIAQAWLVVHMNALVHCQLPKHCDFQEICSYTAQYLSKNYGKKRALWLFLCIYKGYFFCFVSIYMLTLVFVFVCVCMFVYVCVCLCMFVYVCVCLCMFVCVCVCLCVCGDDTLVGLRWKDSICIHGSNDWIALATSFYLTCHCPLSPENKHT